MFMEAVIESLKDLEMRNPNVEEQQSNGIANPPEPSQKDGPRDSNSSTREHTRLDPATTSTANGSDSGPELPSSMVRAANGAPSSDDSISTGTSTRADVSAGARSNSDTDIDDRTKATVTVVKNPTNNIMDGLLRRWDLNFFKNR